MKKICWAHLGGKPASTHGSRGCQFPPEVSIAAPIEMLLFPGNFDNEAHHPEK